MDIYHGSSSSSLMLVQLHFILSQALYQWLNRAYASLYWISLKIEASLLETQCMALLIEH